MGHIVALSRQGRETRRKRSGHQGIKQPSLSSADQTLVSYHVHRGDATSSVTAIAAWRRITESELYSSGHTESQAELVRNRTVCKLDHQHLATHLLAIVIHDGLLGQELVGICNEATAPAETVRASQHIQLQDLSNG